jgi:hypothetical protein
MSIKKTQISKNIQDNFSIFSHSTNDTSNNSTKHKIQLYSLKPQRFTIPKDVNPLFIFQNLINEINQIFPSMSKKISLSTNSNQIRTNLIKNIKNFIEKYKLSQKNFFFTVYLFDKLLTKKINLDIEKIALGCLILSIKFNDIDGNIPKIKNFCEILIKNKNLSINEIKKIEIFCLNKLDYNLNFPQPINFLDIYLLNGIIFNNDEKNNNKIINNNNNNIKINLNKDDLFEDFNSKLKIEKKIKLKKDNFSDSEEEKINENNLNNYENNNLSKTKTFNNNFDNNYNNFDNKTLRTSTNKNFFSRIYPKSNEKRKRTIIELRDNTQYNFIY